MTAEEGEALLREMRDEVRPLYKQIERVAAETLRLRPVFLGKQPFPKRCGMIRKAMALKINAEPASEILAAFFMERYADAVIELLDALGLEHDEGVLKDLSPKPPTKKKLKEAVTKFRGGESGPMRELLLRTFAAQTAIDWPDLDAMVFPEAKAPAGT
jgi:hypothetical protein